MPSNLPASPTALVGRQPELHHVRTQLMHPEVRLLTLTGAGGCGKTRLALEAAERLMPAFEHGAWFVDLAPCENADVVLPTIGRVLGVSDSVPLPFLDWLIDCLRGQSMLLVLDNFEHVLDAALNVAEILQRCRHVKVLTTSREPLRLRWEHEVPLAPLAVPDEAALHDLEALAEVPAVSLFVHRARAVDPSFRLTAANATLVAQVCVRLDGLPLALELAAARTKLLPLDVIVGRLDQGLLLLSGETRDAPLRHRTLSETIGWSYALLSADEQSLLRRVAVFVGGCTVEAAALAAGKRNRDAVLECLGALVEKNLLTRESHPDGIRFQMLGTIRQFALEQLREHGEEDAANDKRAEYVVAFADAIAQELSGPREQECLPRVDAEYENIRATVRRALEMQQNELALRICAGLERYCRLRGRLFEVHACVTQALAGLDRSEPTELLARALDAAGRMSWQTGEVHAAIGYARDSVAAWGLLGNRHGRAVALHALGDLLSESGNQSEAQLVLEESLRIFEGEDDVAGVALATHGLGMCAAATGDIEAADRLLASCLRLRRTIGHQSSIARVLIDMAMPALASGQTERAEALAGESLTLFLGLGHRLGTGYALVGLGHVAIWRGHDVRAIALGREALEIGQQLQSPWLTARALELLACIASRRGKLAQAARWLSAADRFRRGTRLRSVIKQHDPEATLAAVRSSLGEVAFAAAWDSARGASPAAIVSDALAETLTELPAPGAEPQAVRVPTSGETLGLTQLSPREREVAVLVARGLSNRQIADELVITHRTAERHVARILAKLGLSTRAQIAAWVTAHGGAAVRHPSASP